MQAIWCDGGQALPGTSFTVDGPAPARDGGLVTAAAELKLANGLSFGGKFDGEFSSTTRSYAGTGTMRYVW